MSKGKKEYVAPTTLEEANAEIVSLIAERDEFAGQVDTLTSEKVNLQKEVETAEKTIDELQKQLNDVPASATGTTVISKGKKYLIMAKFYFDPNDGPGGKKVDVAKVLAKDQKRIDALIESGSSLLKEVK